MALTKITGHPWIRDRLMNLGKTQRDMAKALDWDNGQVSKFLKNGQPKISTDRAILLARLLQMPLEELMVRLTEKLPPPKWGTLKPIRPHDFAQPAPATNTDVSAALDNLRAAVALVRTLLPTARVRVSIEYGSEGEWENARDIPRNVVRYLADADRDGPHDGG